MNLTISYHPFKLHLLKSTYLSNTTIILPGKTADLAAVVLHEGLGHVCLVRASMTITRAKIEQPIPRKRRGSCTNHDKAMLRYTRVAFGSLSSILMLLKLYYILNYGLCLSDCYSIYICCVR